jgi:hypothetical protein
MRCVEIEDKIIVDMVRRTGGGWLAVSAPGMLFKIGVTGPTEEETKERFKYTYKRWQEIYEMGSRAPGQALPNPHKGLK